MELKGRRALGYHYLQLRDAGFVVVDDEDKQMSMKTFIRTAENGRRVNLEKMRANGQIDRWPNVKVGFSSEMEWRKARTH